MHIYNAGPGSQQKESVQIRAQAWTKTGRVGTVCQGQGRGWSGWSGGLELEGQQEGELASRSLEGDS